MTVQMIIAIAITVLMIVLIMMEKLPFGAPPLLACLLLVIFGITDIPGAFAGFANATIVMLAEFMAIIAALQKTSMIAKFKEVMFNLANNGGMRSYILIILIVMLFASLFGTGSTAFYVLTIGILSTLPYNKKLPPSKILMPAGFAANHPLIPFNTALQYGILIAVLKSAGIMQSVSVLKFVVINVFLSAGFLLNCVLQYKFMPDHPINNEKKEETKGGNFLAEATLPKWKENVVYFVFVVAVIGMLFQGKIGDAGYAIAGLSVGVILVIGVLNFDEIRDAIAAPIILMSAGVIGVANALGSTGLTKLVGKTVAGLLGTNISAFALVFIFCILTSLLATLTGTNIGTVYVFAPLVIATCHSLGFDPRAAASAVVLSAWCGHFLPIDGMPALILGTGKYSAKEFWKFTIPQYFIRLLFLTVGSLLVFPA